MKHFEIINNNSENQMTSQRAEMLITGMGLAFLRRLIQSAFDGEINMEIDGKKINITIQPAEEEQEPDPS